MPRRLIVNPTGGYRFLPGIDPYSSGVIAEPGYEMIHVTLDKPLPWHDGLVAARQYLESQGLARQCLCGVELRCREPHSFGGFLEFNTQYRALLEDWGMLVDGMNPVARTNVAPVVNPPDETVLHAFTHTAPSESNRSTFVVAGGGELPHRELAEEHIVRLGETSDDAIIEKADCVVRIMRTRLERLGAEDDSITTIDVYTAHPLRQALVDAVIPATLAAASRGVNWFYSRPPIRHIEFEMDVRGVAQELTVGLQES